MMPSMRVFAPVPESAAGAATCAAVGAVPWRVNLTPPTMEACCDPAEVTPDRVTVPAARYQFVLFVET